MAGRWLLDPQHAAYLRTQLAAEVAAYIAQHPQEPALPLETARQRLQLPDRRLVEALLTPPLGVRNGRVIHADVQPALPPDVAAAVDALRRDLTRAPFAAPDKSRLAQLGLTAKKLAAAAQVGALLRVADDTYLLPDAIDVAVRKLSRVRQPFTVSDGRTALGTTRRVAVPSSSCSTNKRELYDWTTYTDESSELVAFPHCSLAMLWSVF